MFLQYLYALMFIIGIIGVCAALKKLVDTAKTYPIATIYYRGVIVLLYIFLIFYVFLLVKPLFDNSSYYFFMSFLAMVCGIFVFAMIKSTIFALHKNDFLRTIEYSHKQLKNNAKIDRMTGAIAKDDFEKILDEALLLTKFNQQYVLLFIDVNHLAVLNKTHGNATGDAVLLALVSSLKSVLRTDDVVARVGDDEFCILGKLGGTSNFTSHVESLMSRLQGIESHYYQQVAVPLSIAIGVCQIKNNSLDAIDYIDKAESACLEAKKQQKQVGSAIHFAIAKS